MSGCLFGLFGLSVDVVIIAYIHLQVREMVEIITREFIQMAGSAGEVRAIHHNFSNID